MDRDIHHVETRQYALPAGAGNLLALPNITSPAWLQRHTQHRQHGVHWKGQGLQEGVAYTSDMVVEEIGKILVLHTPRAWRSWSYQVG